MFRCVCIAEPRCQPLMDLRDALWPIRRHLLADRQMQPHVQERILTPARGREFGSERFLCGLEPRDVLGVFRNHGRKLCLQRLERGVRRELAPGLQIHATQLVTALTGKNRHSVTLKSAGAAARR